MRTFLRDFRDAVDAYSQAFRLIRELRLWGYIMIPGLLSIVYGLALAALAWKWSGPLAERIVNAYPFDWGSAVIVTVASYIGWLIAGALGFVLYKYVILIMVAPFMSPLSERIENHLSGSNDSAKFDVMRMAGEIVRGVRISLRNIIRELFFTFILFIISFIPLVGVVSAPLIFLVQSYYAGFGNMDYTLERHMGVRQSAMFVRDYKGLAVGNGMLFLLILMVPVIGLFFAPGLATVAGALETVDRLEHEGSLSR